MNILLLLIIQPILGLLSNIIAGFLTSSFEQRKPLAIVLFVILSILSVVIITRQEDHNKEESVVLPKKSSLEEPEEVKPKIPEKDIRDTVRIIERYPPEKTEPDKIHEARESYDKDGNLEVTDINGNKYKTFKFENTIWLASNLNTDIGENYVYDDKPSNAIYSGRFYNTTSALTGCELLGKGWRLPTDLEFDRLILLGNESKDTAQFINETKLWPEKAYLNFMNRSKSNFNIKFGGSVNKIIFGRIKYAGLFEYASYWAIDRNSKRMFIYDIIKEDKYIMKSIDYAPIVDHFKSCRCVKEK